MTFFNKKEEVMKIELTPYGRYLLSIGKLKPHSYRFFDDNVIYDNAAIGIPEEEQNLVHSRVTNETPILKGNPNITGAETNIRKFTTPSVAMMHLREPLSDDSLNTNVESIGTCAHDSDNGARYGLDIFGATLITGSISNTYNSDHSDGVPIPQIPINMFISASAHEDISSIELNPQQTAAYSDGTGYALSYKNPIIRLREFNGFDEKDNFVVTAYKVDASNTFVEYTRLKMPQTVSPIVNDLLIEDTGIEIQEQEILDDPVIIEYEPDELLFYIEIETDRNIPDEEICNMVKDYEIENIFLDEEIICPDDPLEGNFDIYGTFVEDGDLEECD